MFEREQTSDNLCAKCGRIATIIPSRSPALSEYRVLERVELEEIFTLAVLSALISYCVAHINYCAVLSSQLV